MSLAIRQSAAFVPGTDGPCFRLISEPADVPARGTVLAAPAFAEEMNKARRMSARLARLLAGAGWRVVQRDLSGCGDSACELRDARWTGWLDELRSELLPLRAQGPVWLWGLRAGALLAAALAAEWRELNLLLWQPALSGRQHLQQFLRLHAGARIVGAAPGAEVTPAQALRAGRTVEVGGYELSADLAAALEQASFTLPDGHVGRVCWFELSADGAASPASRAAAEALAARSLRVELTALVGPSFWQTQEIEESEALLQRSCQALDG